MVDRAGTDEWGADVTFAGSQKGLMLPPGLSFLAVSDKAYAASESASTPRGYWDWRTALQAHASGSFPYTPATSLVFGLHESTDMLLTEGLANVYARHARLGQATRAAVDGWELEIVCADRRNASDVVTAIQLPDADPDVFRDCVLERSNVTLGAGLGRLAKNTFRIGHLGQLSDAMLIGALGAVEVGLEQMGVQHRSGGTDCALRALTTSTPA